MSPKRRISEILLAILIAIVAPSAATFVVAQEASADPETIRVETVLVNVPLIVSDRDGRFIGGLKKSDFMLRVDGQDQPIEYFADAESPIDVALVLDLSGSVISVLQNIKEAAKKFVEQLKPDDRASLVTFDQKKEIAVREELTPDKKKLSSTIGKIGYDKSGDYREAHKLPVFPDMYDAIANVMRSKFAGVPRRKAIIVLTDGYVTGRTISPQAFDDMIVEGETLIYPVMFVTREHIFESAMTNIAGKQRGNTITGKELSALRVTRALTNIAAKTGGRLLIAAKDTDFNAAFTAIGDELRKQYFIGFLPSPESAKKGGRVSIAVTDPAWSVRSKSSVRLKRRQEGPATSPPE
jgi:Ca-activated chloride channel family protein